MFEISLCFVMHLVECLQPTHRASPNTPSAIINVRFINVSVILGLASQLSATRIREHISRTLILTNDSLRKSVTIPQTYFF